MPDKGKKILLVDDEAGFAELLRDLLSMDGYEVRLAYDGIEGLDVLKEFTPDVIISDVMMPRMGGLEFFKVVRDQPSTSNIPFLFISGFHDERVLEEARSVGVFNILQKPVDMEKIEEELSRIIK
jgi:CheY-like chemotaxis protein